MDKDTRRLALISVTLGVCLVTLTPIQPGLLERVQNLQMEFSPAPFLEGSRALYFYDFLQNFLLFAPLGFLIADSRPVEPPRAAYLRAALLAFALSAMVESAQTFLPGRYSSVWDIGCNTLGGIAGAGLRRAFRFGGPRN